VAFILQDKRVLIDEACSTAQEFTKLYYECLDKKRNVTLSFAINFNVPNIQQYF
jgi:NTF2-related export protein 1/2